MAKPGTQATFLRNYRQILLFNLKNFVLKEIGNIDAAVRRTIPGIGTGNPGKISSGGAENGVTIILP